MPLRGISALLLVRVVSNAVGHDGLNAHFGKVLPVALKLLVLLLALEVEDQNLIAAPLAEDFGCDGGRGWFGKRSGFTGNCKHIAELNGRTSRGNALNLKNVARRDSILLASGANHCVHNKSSGAMGPKTGRKTANGVLDGADTDG